MAKERQKSPRARLFVALDLPEGVRRRIEAWGNRELADSALRPVRREALHITLAFLGYLPEKAIPRLEEIVEAGGGASPRVELRDPVARPSLSQASFFALPADSPGAVTLQAELQKRLVAAGLYKPEKRHFWPHVTVARVRRKGKGSRQPTSISKSPDSLPEGLLEPFDAVRMTLYGSKLQPQGAIYTPLAQVELSRNGQQ